MNLQNGQLEHKQYHIDHPRGGTSEHPLSDHHPLTRGEIKDLLHEAVGLKAFMNSANQNNQSICSQRIASIQVRLGQGIVGNTSPDPYEEGTSLSRAQLAIDEMYVNQILRGGVDVTDELVDWFYKTMQAH